jgi:hypothetical protein
MVEEDQKFMAIEGLHTWIIAVSVQVDRINASRSEMLVIDHQARPDAIRAFQRERHLFLISANKVLQYIDWVKRLDFLDNSIFDEFTTLRKDIKDLRDMNEHVVEYFTGTGRSPDIWFSVTDEAVADASSTVGTRIGNRLDWLSVVAAAERLSAHLPSMYIPDQV